MIFVDTHAHLYSSEFDEDRSDVVARSLEAGVSRIILPDVDSHSREALMEMARNYDCCSPMVGLHPTSVNDNPKWREELAAVGRLLEQGSDAYCGVGEIGIDLYWSKDFEAEQREAFREQIKLALRYDLPVAIHAREAWDAIIEELTPFATEGLRGVIHAFTGEVVHYRLLRELGDFLFGIGGVVTFKKSALAPVVAEMSLSDLLLETDAPYLTPTPHRGKRNDSSYIPLIAACIAELHATTVESVAQITTSNAERMFKI